MHSAYSLIQSPCVRHLLGNFWQVDSFTKIMFYFIWFCLDYWYAPIQGLLLSLKYPISSFYLIWEIHDWKLFCNYQLILPGYSHPLGPKFEELKIKMSKENICQVGGGLTVCFLGPFAELLLVLLV